MAGDWMKFEKATPDKPEVFQMAEILGIDPDAVTGKLLRVWNWFDEHSQDGNANVTVRALLDRFTGVSGFTKAMESVGWLEIEGDQMTIPNFTRHNGQTAKKRCSTNRRVAKARSKHSECNAPSVTNVTPKALPKALPEKRREEKSSTDTPHGVSEGEVSPPPASKSFEIPTLDHARNFAASDASMIPPECVEAWHDDRNSMGWEKPKGQTVVPIRDWRSDLRGYGRNWKENRAGKAPASKPPPPPVRGPDGWREVFREIIPNGPIPIQWDHVDTDLQTEILGNLKTVNA